MNTTPPTPKQPAIENQSTEGCRRDGSCSPPIYEIEHVRDFLKVPEDRLPQCLEEFAEFLKLSREMLELTQAMADVIGVEGPGGEVMAYHWIDDGKTEKSVTMVCEANVPVSDGAPQPFKSE